MISRRALLAGLVLTGYTLLGLRVKADAATDSLKQKIADLERKSGGHLGVAVLDTGSSELISHRGTSAFPFAAHLNCLLLRLCWPVLTKGRKAWRVR